MTDDTEEQAKALLDRLGTERKKLEAKLEEVQQETHDAIVDVLMARTLGPSEVARRVQYDRQHVARIAKKAGVPPLREATVVSRAKAGPPKEPRPAVAPARRQVTHALPKAVPGISRKVAALLPERIEELADRAAERYPEWVEEMRQEYPHLHKRDLDLLIVDLGLQKGFKIPELADPPVADPADRPVSEEEAAEFAVLARSRANEMQSKKLDQEAEKATDGSNDFAVMHAALDMGLLKHDEVYGERPAGSEEKTA